MGGPDNSVGLSTSTGPLPDRSLDDDLVKSLLGKEAPNEVIIQGHNITEIKSLKGDYSSVRRLDISFNTLKSLKGIEQFPRLRQLSAYCCRLDDVGCINEMSYLTSLMIQQNSITRIPSAFKTMKYLRELRIDRNQLTSIRNLSGCCCLRTLDISFNEIESLSGLSGLQSLQELRANHNNITSLETLKSLPSIRELEVTHNKLVNLDGVQHLTTLESIHADHNLIDTFRIPQTYTKQWNPNLKPDSESNSLNSTMGTQFTRKMSSSKMSMNNPSVGFDTSRSRSPSFDFGSGTRSRSESVDFKDETVTILGLRSLVEVSLSNNRIDSLDGLDSLGTRIVMLNINNNRFDFSSEKSETLVGTMSTLKRLSELKMGSAVEEESISEFKTRLFQACSTLKVIDGRTSTGELCAPPEEATMKETETDNDLNYESSDSEDMPEKEKPYEVKRKTSLQKERKVSVSGSAKALKEMVQIDDVPSMEIQFKKLLSNCRSTLAVASCHVGVGGSLPETPTRKAPVSVVLELRRAAERLSVYSTKPRASSLSRISETSYHSVQGSLRCKDPESARSGSVEAGAGVGPKTIDIKRIGSAPNLLLPPSAKRKDKPDLRSSCIPQGVKGLLARSASQPSKSTAALAALQI